MSDPMTNTEIEDVLSSIRRLVSEELRPHGRPAAADAAQAPAANSAPRVSQSLPGQAGKLLLTPALRVVSDGDDSYRPADDAALFAPEDEPALPKAGLAGMPPPPADHGAEDDADVILSADPDPSPVFHRSGDVHGDAADMQHVISRLGAAVAGDDEWESPVGDLDDFGDAVAPGPAAAGARGADFGRPEPLGSRLHLSVSLSDDPDFLTPLDDGATPGGMDASGDDFLMAGDDFLATAAAAPPQMRRVEPPVGDAWADAAAAEARAELEREPDENPYAQPEVAFDEEVLRDLVRDIIREELAGSLGERITRNVRKLVRVEIARALAVRDFE
jgi:hypothetical protein